MINVDEIKTALATVVDPELGHNIVELGLIYNIELVARSLKPDAVRITMTLTTPGCPLAPFFLSQVKETVAAVAELTPDDIDVQLVFDPPWTQDMMTEELKLQMGM